MLEFKAEELSIMMKSLGNPTRLKILCILKDGEFSVGALQGELKTTIANISQHLSILRKNGIVKSRKEANIVFNRISDDRIITLMQILNDLYCT